VRYTKEDIDFAWRLLHRRHEMDERETREWLRDRHHVALIDELAALRGRVEPGESGETGQEELARLHRAIRRRELVIAWRRAGAAAVVAGMVIASFILYSPRELPPATEIASSEEIHPGTVRARLLTGMEEIELNASTRSIENARVGGIENDSSSGLDYTRVATATEEQVFHTLKIPTGGFYRLTLPDGTRVWLNSESELHYPVPFTTDERVVTLRGEGYFEVARDVTRVFRVRLENAIVTVPSTSFNINAYGDDGRIYTTLVEGTLSVYSTGKGTETLLHADMQCALNMADGTTSVRKVEANRYRSWIDGRFVFESMNLQLIVRQLQRWYDFEVFFSDNEVKEYEFRGVIPRDMPFDTMLSIIAKTTNIQYEIKGRKVIISRR
jgi:ferric-dicitrate binding protein FerR (iron transport regulator)